MSNSTSPVAVHSLHEFVFSVPDLDEARRFYECFGLDVKDDGDQLGLYTFNSSHRWGRVIAGETKRLQWLTFGIYDDDLDAFERKLRESGVAFISPPPHAEPAGFWISGPDRLPIQILAAQKSSPRIKSLRLFPPEVSNSGRAPRRSQVKLVRPNRLSHVLLFTADVDASRRFYEEILGLRLSDHSGSIIAFMHSPHGSDHHLIALAKSSHSGLHHSSWDVSSFDDVALGNEQMSKAGYADGWGIGRHVLGSNYFRYVRDPWGSYAEYSFDIDFIPAGQQWPAGDYPPEDSLYVWGPAVPEDFIVNHEPQAM